MGQTTVSVTDATSTFTQVFNSSRVSMTDFIGDQATGQGADDFVVNGVFTKYGLVNGTQTQLVRAIFTKYNSQGFGGNIRVGVDANFDGNIEVFYGVVDSGSGRGITFQNPTGTSNTIGNTTLGTTYSTVTFSAINYNYTQVGTYGQVTFAMPISTLQSALATVGINITDTSFLRYIFGTSTNQNTINQDLYGVNGVSSTINFAVDGAFTEYQDFYGRVIPEPSTYAQVGLVLGMTAFIRYKRKKKVV